MKTEGKLARCRREESSTGRVNSMFKATKQSFPSLSEVPQVGVVLSQNADSCAHADISGIRNSWAELEFWPAF